MNSSWSSMVTPMTSFTGTTDFAKRPSSQACLARRWLSAANASTSRRLWPLRVASRSALTPCGTKCVGNAMDGSVDHEPPAAPMGTRLMLSTPPPTTRSASPALILAAARLTASRPDEQKRFTWKPGTLSS
jgi:hypothetical protein